MVTANGTCCNPSRHDVVSDKITLDKDFGGGYRYALIVADVTVEP